MTNSLLTDHFYGKIVPYQAGKKQEKKQTAEKGCKENADEIQ